MAGKHKKRFVPHNQRRDAELTRLLRIFLGRLSVGDEIKPACKAAGLGVTTVWEIRYRDPEFDAAWRSAVEYYYVKRDEQLLDEAQRRAVDGVTRDVYKGGVVVGQTVEYSDALLAQLLGAQRWFAEQRRRRLSRPRRQLSEQDRRRLTQRQRLRLANKPGVPVEIVQLADAKPPLAEPAAEPDNDKG